MTGITRFGAYIPYYRLAHKEIARAWGGRAGAGEFSAKSYRPATAIQSDFVLPVMPWRDEQAKKRNRWDIGKANEVPSNASDGDSHDM